MQSVIMLNSISMSVIMLNSISLSVIMLNSISLIVIMLNVFMVIVMAPSFGFNQYDANVLFISLWLTPEAR
jgi:hypothetical protein